MQTSTEGLINNGIAPKRVKDLTRVRTFRVLRNIHICLAFVPIETHMLIKERETIAHNRDSRYFSEKNTHTPRDDDGAGTTYETGARVRESCGGFGE